MKKPRILYMLPHYPQISETYMQAEIDAVRDEYEIRIISLNRPDHSYLNHDPYQLVDDPAQLREVVEDFRPAVIHTHWLHRRVPEIGELARHTSVPFTIRSHSFDSIWHQPSFLARLFGKSGVPQRVASMISVINDDFCLGVLAFPFVRPHFEKAGIRPDKIFECYPVVDYDRFLDRSPNGDAVMNGGAALPKKKMEDFLALASGVRNKAFNLYAMGYQVDTLRQANAKLGSPVNLIPAVEPNAMPREYKKHQWLVYTASSEIITTGWPIMIAEAQASGVGVCMRNLRPDLKEYVGECGFLYDAIDDVREIVSQPFPEELRQIGFTHAQKSDIRRHKHILTDLWDRAISRRER